MAIITETKAGHLQRLLYELLTGPLHAGSGAIPIREMLA